MKKTEVSLSDIRIDGGTQPRTGIDEGVVQEYAQRIQAGDEFPPLDVFSDGTDLWLASGFHRYFAHKSAGVLVVQVLRHSGTKRDAILFAVGTNAAHGLRRTNDDKRRAVRMLLDDAEWGQWSDREIASRCCVTHPFVAKLREELAPRLTGNVTSEKAPEERRYTTKHGTEATMATAKIGRSAERELAPMSNRRDDEANDVPSAAEMLDELNADLSKAEARCAELEKALNEGGKEQTVLLLRRLEQAERARDDAMAAAQRSQARADRYEKLLARCGRAVGDRDLDKVAAKVEAMARRMRESEAA